MKSHYSSNDITELTFRTVRQLIDVTDLDLKKSVKFVDVYNKACKNQVRGINNEYDTTNADLMQYVRDNLLDKGYIFVDPEDVDSIYLTKKAIDEYSDSSAR